MCSRHLYCIHMPCCGHHLRVRPGCLHCEHLYTLGAAPASGFSPAERLCFCLGRPVCATGTLTPITPSGARLSVSTSVCAAPPRVRSVSSSRLTCPRLPWQCSFCQDRAWQNACPRSKQRSWPRWCFGWPVEAEWPSWPRRDSPSSCWGGGHCQVPRMQHPRRRGRGVPMPDPLHCQYWEQHGSGKHDPPTLLSPPNASHMPSNPSLIIIPAKSKEQGWP